jgi:hypothetical protein
MSIRSLTVGLIVAWSLAATSAWAAEQLPFKATFSGTLVSTAFDTDGDGAPANYNVLEGHINLSAFSLQVLDESVRAEPATCPNGGSALHVMLFLENTLQALFIFNGLRSRHYQRALLGYHYPSPSSNSASGGLYQSRMVSGLRSRSSRRNAT